jgi:hypothetical protein
VLTLTGNSGETVAESRDDDKLFNEDDDAISARARYTRSGYLSVFWPAAFAVIVASLILWPVRERLRHKKPAGEAPGVATYEATTQDPAVKKQGGSGGAAKTPLLTDEFY